MTFDEAIEICRNPKRSIRDAKRVLSWASADPSPDKVPYLLLLNSNAYAAVKKIHPELIEALSRCAEADPSELWECLERDWSMDRQYVAIDALLNLPLIDTSRLLRLAETRTPVWHSIERWSTTTGVEIPPKILGQQQKYKWELTPDGVWESKDNMYTDLANRRPFWPAEKDLAAPPRNAPARRSAGYGEAQTELTSALDRIYRSLQRLAPTVAAELRPGLTMDEIAMEAGEFPFALPEEIYELYRWRNGSPTLGGLVPEFCFMSLREVVDYYTQFHDIPRSRKNWLPLFDFNGDVVVCSVCGKEEATTAPLIQHDYECGSKKLAQSLTAFMSRIADRFERGDFEVSEHGAIVEKR